MEQEKKFQRRPNRPFPQYSLEGSLVIARAIQDNNAAKPMKRLLLADAIGRKPTTFQFRDLLSSSYKYGLTSGTEKADYIELTDLGKQITKPTSTQQEIASKQRAVLTPQVFNDIFSHYKNARWPRGQFFENTLEVEFKIPLEYVKEVITILEQNGRFSGLLRDISGSPMIMFDDYSPPQKETEDEEENLKEHSSEMVEIPSAQPQQQNTKEVFKQKEEQRPIFIAHGKNKKPLEQLKKILDQFKIPYKIAVDEPHSGRPISQKVRELMNTCGSAIFIFSKDGETKDEEQHAIANLNVVFELGAASVLYGEKVIIFKEEGINFSSDFSNLGYIAFDDKGVEAKALDLIKELIAMGSVKIVST